VALKRSAVRAEREDHVVLAPRDSAMRRGQFVDDRLWSGADDEAVAVVGDA
jgi:hypothetical protein